MNPQSVALSRLLRQLEKTQWLSHAELEALQTQRLEELATHCAKHSAQFARRLAQAELTVADLIAPNGLQRLPVLTRRALQTAPDVFCDAVPTSHEPVYELQSSGSTGEPVVVKRTAISELDWMATTMRDHLWHSRNFAQRICVARAYIEHSHANNWGPPVNLLFESGPLLGMPITMDVAEQLRHVADFRPQILLSYPNNIAALARLCGKDAVSLPELRQILTIGETLTPEVRALVQDTFGASVTDMYSSQELGTIALQCPQSPLYHVMAENLVLEVLSADGARCCEGETGRLVVTDLRNMATPLIRYDTGDYGEMGPPCPCGRGLPTLARILGRERNLLFLPDGARNWPVFGFTKFREIAPVTQYQFIQRTRDSLDMRLVTERPLNADEEDQLRALVQKSVGHAFNMQFAYFAEQIPIPKSGKFEEFMCQIAE